MNENECLYEVVLKQKEDTSSDALVIFWEKQKFQKYLNNL
jgi:hypothetical protein